MRILVTGAAGFIGYHVAGALLARGDEVVGLDNLNDYYDTGLKQARLKRLEARAGFRFTRLDLADRKGMEDLFEHARFERVIHLAAQAGVRYSLKNPHAYVTSNQVGFLHVLEGCRHQRMPHLVYASSSSVYGANTRMPFSVHHNVDHPVSLYAATKKSNELMAHAYSHLYGLPVTGLRFFTVYGPWGRPDMAYFSFTKAIIANKPIEVYGEGKLLRDFTYIDDAVQGVVRAADRIPLGDPNWSADAPDPSRSRAPYRLYNIGNHKPEPVSRLIELLEQHLGKTAHKRYLPIQPGDVEATYADVDDLARDVGFAPATKLEEGLKRFVAWYREFYNVR